MKVVAVFTCFNRKEKTERMITTICNDNNKIEFEFLIVDDGSSDGTVKMINRLAKNGYNITLISGGDLYYSRAMHIAMNELLASKRDDYTHMLLLNDDVVFFSGEIEKAIKESEEKHAVIVGVCCRTNGKLSYGAIKYHEKLKYSTLGIEHSKTECDTFNANCVIIPRNIFEDAGSYDGRFRHSLGDFDYGLKISRLGYKIYPSSNYVGLCDRNPNNNTWCNNKLPMLKRIKLKEDIKGQPCKEWYYYIRKNFGLIQAIYYSITPYIRIILKK